MHSRPTNLTTTPAAQIATDLDIIRNLRPEEVVVEGAYDHETGTTDYRVITDAVFAPGCFHRITGLLTAKCMEILSAQVTTSLAKIVVDSFRVIDRDFASTVPDFRIEDVARAIRQVVSRQTTVKEMFQRHKRFQWTNDAQPTSDLPTRVVVDNNSSRRCTVIDIFCTRSPRFAVYHCQKSLPVEPIDRVGENLNAPGSGSRCVLRH